jgi:hypothetical protein
MSYRHLESYQEISQLPIKDRWTSCSVGLEHSVSGDDYWLSCEIKFSADGTTDLVVYIGRGSRSDGQLVLSTLEANGFKLSLRRYMREWEYFDYLRKAQQLNP